MTYSRTRALPHVLGALMVLTLLMAASFSSVLGAQGKPLVLARVEVTQQLTDLHLPIYAHLRDPRGGEYALVIATHTQLKQSGAPYQVLDAFTPGTTYAIVEPHGHDDASSAPRGVVLLMNDGEHQIIRTTPSQTVALRKQGYHLQQLDDTPMVLRTPDTLVTAQDAPPNPQIAEIISKVTQNAVFTYNGNLTGETPVTIGGSSYTITTRNTYSGTPIQKATQYVYEFMQAQGQAVSYHSWSSGRNVIGEQRGTTRPNEIIIIGAHLDNLPSTGRAPGADDNGSGSTAVMLAAEIFRQYKFERTIRFAFFTGEEQGLLGAKAYATTIYNARENIVAMYNMDMIAYDSVNQGRANITTRTTSSPGYAADKALADTFVSVVNTYGLGIRPTINPSGSTRSDHAAFWARGYAAIHAIEGDFSDYYHSAGDKRSTLNMTFFTNMVKASLGTVAQLAIPAGTGITPTPITITPGTVTPTPGVIFADNFETNTGWTTNPDGTDTATTGRWERGDPEATDYNGPKQLGTTSSGIHDLVTGRLAGSGVGDYDLDGGVTSIRSPSITLPSSGNLTLSLRYYLAHASNASSADYFRVKIVGSTTTTVFERLGAASDVDASWQTATINLSSYAGQTIRLLIEAADGSTASLVEAAVDDVSVTGQ